MNAKHSAISAKTLLSSPIRTRLGGFTLVELMITIVILAILIGIAVPSFDAFNKKSTVESIVSNLSSAVATARTEAASRNTVVTICAKNLANDNTCALGTDTSVWNNGWLIIQGAAPAGGSTAISPAAIIDIYRNGGRYKLAAGDETFFSFNSQGFLSGSSADSLIVCAPNDDTDNKFSRGIYINTSGLVIKTRDTDGDGVHNNPADSNNEIDCSSL